MRSSDFMRAVPAAARAQLPAALGAFQVSLRPWLVQLYYGSEPRIHYEAVLLPSRFRQGANTRWLEVGLHFESRDHDENRRLLELCYAHLFEIKTELGTHVEAEPWDRGWTKLYEVLPHDGLTAELLERTARRLARYIDVLQPLIAPPAPARRPARRR